MMAKRTPPQGSRGSDVPDLTSCERITPEPAAAPDAGDPTQINPAHYPPGQLPKLTRNDLLHLANEPKLSESDYYALQWEHTRALNKLKLVISLPASGERAASCNSTIAISGWRSFTDNAAAARAREERDQQRRAAARKDRSPFTTLLREELKAHPQSSARDLWLAMRRNDEDWRISIVGDETMEWEHMVGSRHERCGDMTFASFESKVSALRADFGTDSTEKT